MSKAVSSVVLPDLVVPMGPRSIISLIGIVVLVYGVWYVDRTWDEKGSKAYDRAYKEAKDKSKVFIPPKELDEAFEFPVAFLVGWALYAYSNLWALDGSPELMPTQEGIIAAIASVFLSLIASVPMGNAVRDRDASAKMRLSILFILTWLVLTVFTVMANRQVSYLYCPLGMVCIIASMKILWKHRKMGDSWERNGKPNPNPIVYNIGGPLFVWGWFLFWLGMCGTKPVNNNWIGLPIYYNMRTLFAMASGCGMVPIVLMVDYAHDEGGQYIGFGTDGRFFGAFFESPIPFLMAWYFFGVAALLPLTTIKEVTTRQWLILANCALQGFDAGILIQTALYEGDMARKNKWSIPFVVLFATLAINIGLHGGLALGLSVPGAILIVLGQKTVFGDRKRGDYFMQHNQKPNPNPIVYSYGELFFMTGWILISLAMALPMK